MFLYIVRHGIPDYATDTLLEEGWEQARLAAGRLAASGIDEIHASPMGRARQTAQPLAEKLSLPVRVEEWAYELGDEAKTTWPDGEKRHMSGVPATNLRLPEYARMTSEDAMEKIDCFRAGPGFEERYRHLSEGLNGMLEELGYRRLPSGLYQPTRPNNRHVALFCHAGMLRVLLSHALSIPIHLLVSSAYVHFTGITILYFDSRGVGEVAPTLISLGDTGHLYAGGRAQEHYFYHEPY